MKKMQYNGLGIQIGNQFFNNKLGNINAWIYICDNARYPKRVAKKMGEFESDSNIKLFNYTFEKGKWFVYLNFKGNFYIFKLTPISLD